MPEYQAKPSNLLNFDLTKGDESIGKLLYKGWFKFDASIEITNGKSYQVEPKGFWGTTIELKDEERVLLKFNMNWNGEIVIQTYFDNIEKGFIFKHRGVFRESFILINEEGTELLAMKPHLKWNLTNYQYELTTADRFETFPNKELLLLAALHCANYYMSMIANVTGA